jgi:small subunit ribosomal protein S17
MKTFEDTHYVYHPIDSDGQYHPELYAGYTDMTNEELMDNSTIPGWDYLIHSPPIDKSQIPNGALVGTVVSTKMQKTVNVAVNRYKVHGKYKKRIRYTRKFMAHDEAEVARDGDTVMIVPCQRLSKNKHFMLHEIIRPKGQL